jgi:hypothetical protein
MLCCVFIWFKVFYVLVNFAWCPWYLYLHAIHFP